MSTALPSPDQPDTTDGDGHGVSIQVDPDDVGGRHAGVKPGGDVRRASLVQRYLPLGISALALLVALAAFVRPSPEAAVASAPSDTVPSTISDPTSSTETSLDSTSTEPTSTEPSDGSDTTPPLPTEGYVVSYQDQKLVLRPNYSQGCSGRHVDLDAPGIVVDPNAPNDISYDPCNNGGAGPSLDFPPQVAEVSSNSATAADCSKAIRTAPSAQTQTVSRQLVLCTTTDGISTAGQPARSRMVRIVVEGVQKDGTVTLTLTSWEIPS